VAVQRQPRLLTRRAVGEGDVEVSNVVEEMNLVLVKEEAGGNGVHGSITPSLVEETAILVQRLEEVEVRLAAEPLKAANLKVGPLKSMLV
jgi:hypothetical protein